MAAPIKRACESNGDLPTKISTVTAEDNELECFLKWSNENKLWLSPKVRVSKQGSCAQYGMITTSHVDKGECLFRIPRSLLLHPGTSVISDLLEKESESLVSESGWVPLLLCLMYEYNNPVSSWRPYLDLVPDFKELDLPMFWSETDRNMILGSANGVLKSVERDVESLTSEYTSIVLPFIQKHGDVFSPACQSLELYKKMVGFVMAYSFTEPLTEDEDEDEDLTHKKSAPMMVPMADILNHIAHNNAELRFEKEFLTMVSTAEINEDTEVFNTYGMLSNKDELHMYGFAEKYPNNTKDTVDIPATFLQLEAEKLGVHENDRELLSEKWMFLQEQEVIGENDFFVLGHEGVLTLEELEATLKVLDMSRSQFGEHQEKEGWSEAESDDDEDPSDKWQFGPNGITKLKNTWKSLLKGCAERCLGQYKTSLEEDEKQLSSGLHTLSQREKYVLYTNHGQKKLLHQLLQSCS